MPVSYGVAVVLQEGAIRLATSEQATRNMTPTDRQVGHSATADAACTSSRQGVFQSDQNW
jgi:hypothetical protein